MPSHYMDSIMDKLEHINEQCSPTRRDVKLIFTNEGETTPFSTGTQYSGFLESTLYAKGPYAVHKNPVVSYAGIICYI